MHCHPHALGGNTTKVHQLQKPYYLVAQKQCPLLGELHPNSTVKCDGQWTKQYARLIASVSGYTQQATVHVCNVNHCHQLYPNSSLVCCHLHCCKCTDFHYIVRLLEFQLTGISRYCAVLWMVVWSTINLPPRRVLWHGVMDVEEGYWSSSPGGESRAHYWVQSWWLWCWSEILLMTILFCNRTILMSAFVAWQSNYVMSYILLTQKMTHTNYWANIIPTWIPSPWKALGTRLD